MTCAPMRVKKLAKDAVIPQHTHTDDTDVDLSSVEDVALAPGQRALAEAGTVIALPADTMGLVHPRFELVFKRGLPIVNAPSTIDAGYRGELKVCLTNLDPTNAVEITKGDRVIQLVVQKAELSPTVGVDELDETGCGTGGRGSTGVSTTL